MLSKSLEKYKKQLAKFEKVDEVTDDVVTDEAMVTDEVTEEAPIATEDVMSEMNVDEETAINESFLKMQKLAGVITEAEYNKKKSLIETLFLGDLEKMKKSENSKEYTDKEIEDMSLENAKKLYNSVKKSWDVPANNKLKKQLEAKIEKEDPKFFKQTKK